MEKAIAWLSDTPWDAVISINQTLCEAQNLELLKGKNHDKAKSIWENACPRRTTLLEGIEICRKCNDLIPFTFNSGNTFAKIGRTMVEECAAAMPAVEAHMLRTTVGHYVNGQISRAELKSILKLAEKHLDSPKAAPRTLPPVITADTSPAPKQQGQPA